MACPMNGRFADAGIGHAELAVFFLHSFEPLIHIAEFAHVFTESDQARVTRQRGIEGGVDHFKAEHGWR
jgi:hypothetical protein